MRKSKRNRGKVIEELGDAERARMEEWGSLLNLKYLGWPSEDATEGEEGRQLMVEDRQHWLNKVSRQEDRNLESIEKHLAKENMRRFNLTKLAEVEVPRALIELSIPQMEKAWNRTPWPT